MNAAVLSSPQLPEASPEAPELQLLFEPTESLWTPEQAEFIERGRAYAERLGKDIDFPVRPMPRQLHRSMAETGLPGSFARLEAAFEGDVNNFYKAIGFLTIKTIREDWDDQDWIDNYNWLRDAFRQADQPMPPHSVLARQISRLFICPTEEAIREKWGTISAYARHVGGETLHTKRVISNEGLLRAAINHYNQTKQPISRNSTADDPWLGAKNLQRLGGSRNLNLRLRLISSTEGWDQNRLLWWGLTNYMPANQGQMPEPDSIGSWSKQHRGPTLGKIKSQFNRSLQQYHDQLEAAQGWLNSQLIRLNRPDTLGTPGLDRSVLYQAISRNPDLFHPDHHIDPSELGLLYRLKDAQVDARLLAYLIKEGIPFANPEPALYSLATELDAKGVLSTGVLRQLETYITGLAPPEVEMSWSDFIAAHRKEARARQTANVLGRR